MDVEQGGVKLLRVRDDGGGISSDDLPLALARHATSKIRDLEDLERVMSLGFRGEALASISSVSRLTLTSRTRDAEQAWQVETEGRDMASRVQPAAHPVGTSVEVRDLFFNTPARRKFLKAEKTEFDHLQEVIKRLALARFDVAFHLRHNGKTILSLHEAHDDAARARRVGAVCGAGFLEQALPIEVERNGLHLWGWVGLPTFSRSQADLQYFYVNGRAVRDKLVAHAVRQAYRDVLFNGRHPTFVLFFSKSIRPWSTSTCTRPSMRCVSVTGAWSTIFSTAPCTAPWAMCARKINWRRRRRVGGMVRPTGLEAGEFGPQGEMRLAANALLEQPQPQPSYNTAGSGAGSGYQYQYTPRPQSNVPAAEAQAAYREFFKPLPEAGAAAMPDGQGDIPPLGYALAQLKGIYILSEKCPGPGPGGHARRP
nr:hypothetical protein GCM10020185_24470 [Pseudomonas brassicacearum subsp. brassicacearum]